ncbi:DUF1861 family protein [Fundicoccus culcitae]|uniref:DUF1861 family protein n=1 Tax=Fundicoccus culcitae TaxID=2969821 RepID=A0ABY5P8P3_9LACT|nr:DUF1861 family protein [Fundicoccus culcitae]UUX35124.1 DUF1861 family protein [Fundicoccus culcitae]
MDLEMLLVEYRKGEQAKNPEKIPFEVVENKDIYNITAPFKINDKCYIFGRVENRESEFSQVILYVKNNDKYCMVEGFTPLEMQDPFVTFINDEIILGGVVINESKENPKLLEWRTDLFRGKDLWNLEKFFQGPKGMKDIRLKQLEDNRILVLTRPQGIKGGRGKIGAVIINDLDELTIELIEAAPLLGNQFKGDTWGGANEIHLLDSSSVGIIGHIATFDETGYRHYFAMAFILDLSTFDVSNEKIIAERNNFLDGPSKRPDLVDVVFSGGLVLSNTTAELYCGISDADAQKITIKNPFMKEDKNAD